jgi:hypothetical protein
MNPEVHIGAAVIVAHIVAAAAADKNTGKHAGDRVAIELRGETVNKVDADRTAVRIVRLARWR